VNSPRHLILRGANGALERLASALHTPPTDTWSSKVRSAMVSRRRPGRALDLAMSCGNAPIGTVFATRLLLCWPWPRRGVDFSGQTTEYVPYAVFPFRSPQKPKNLGWTRLRRRWSCGLAFDALRLTAPVWNRTGFHVGRNAGYGISQSGAGDLPSIADILPRRREPLLGATKSLPHCSIRHYYAAEPESLMNFLLTPDRRGGGVIVVYSLMPIGLRGSKQRSS
jgi:hypothetical protein